jgi:hypothetical protein
MNTGGCRLAIVGLALRNAVSADRIRNMPADSVSPSLGAYCTCNVCTTRRTPGYFLPPGVHSRPLADLGSPCIAAPWISALDATYAYFYLVGGDDRPMGQTVAIFFRRWTTAPMSPSPAKSIAYDSGSGTTPTGPWANALKPTLSDPVPASLATIPNTRFPARDVEDKSPKLSLENEVLEPEFEDPPFVELLKFAVPFTDAASKSQQPEVAPVRLML